MAAQRGCQRRASLTRTRDWELATRFVFALETTCEPPELGRPVLAIERVMGTFESFEMFSSWMLPPLVRVSVDPVLRLVKVPSGGPPVPERVDLGSLE